MAVLSIYLSMGLVYWLAGLVSWGEPPSLRAISGARRLKIHGVALALCMVLWPLALAEDLRPG